MNKFIFAAVLCGLIMGLAQAQNLWGAEAGVGQNDGQFDTDFTETGDANSLATVGWTALSINDSGGGVTPGQAYWIRNLLGYSQGGYWGGTTPVGSPSQPNGVAIFDSDYLDNNGVPGNFGNGSSPSSHRGELISPPIDLTGHTDAYLALKLFSFYRNFQINQLSVVASVDNGVTWGTPVDYRAYQGELTDGFITVPLPAETLQGVANLTQFRFKLVFDGDYYFALVDDVTLQINDVIFASDFDPTGP